MIVKCRVGDCIYNENEKCTKKEIEIVQHNYCHMTPYDLVTSTRCGSAKIVKGGKK